MFVCLLFVCLCVWGLSFHSGFFHSYWDVTIIDEGLQIVTYARYSWPLSSEDSLACNTYCDSNTYCRAFCSGAVITSFNDFLSRLEFEHHTFRLLGQRCNPRVHAIAAVWRKCDFGSLQTLPELEKDSEVKLWPFFTKISVFLNSKIPNA